MFSKLLLISLFGLFSIVQAAREPYEFQYVHNAKLGVHYKLYLDALDWEKARLRCLADNATLVNPKNELERKAVHDIWKQYLDNEFRGAISPEYLYIGFHDEFVENEFVSGSGFYIDYFDREFESIQPNDARNEKVLAMFKPTGKYHEYPSKGRPSAFMCQKDDHQKNSTKIAFVSREPRYAVEPVSRKRYKLNMDREPWGTARTICISQGGDLAVIKNKVEQEFIVHMLNYPKKTPTQVKHAFIGLHDIFVEGKFTSVEGEELEKIGYANWAPGKPEVNNLNRCVGISNNGEYHNIPCDELNYYICEKPPSIQNKQ